MIFSHFSKRNIDSMLIGTSAALILISFFLVLALKSFKMGLISLIPNLFPAAVGFGHLIKSGQARGVALDSAREFITGEPGECRTSISNRLKDPMFHAGWDFSNCSDEDIMWKTMKKNNKFEMSWKNDSGEMQPMWMQPNLRNLIRKRGTEVLNFIFDQNDKVIALFTHAGFASIPSAGG